MPPSRNNTLAQEFHLELSKGEGKEIELGNQFVNYLQEIARKPMKDNGRLKTILKVEWNKTELPNRTRGNVQSAAKYIQYLINERKQTQNKEEIGIINSSIKTAVADLKDSVERLDPSHEYGFILISLNSNISTEIFRLSKNTFYHNSLGNHIDRYNLDLLAILGLRQSLESRIKKMIGIDILRVGKKSISLSDIIRLIPKLKTVHLHRRFDSDMLATIMEWLNHFIHRSLRPEPWKIHDVISYIDPLFTLNNIDNLYSVFISSFVEDEIAYRNEVEELIKEQIAPDCFVVWVHSAEVAKPFKKRKS